MSLHKLEFLGLTKFSSATLLLAHSPSQSTNQSRLESYLSASTPPNLDISDQFGASSQHSLDVSAQFCLQSGTDTPRDLALTTKIIELYTLHVLPRNGEWQYAKDFIRMSEILDEERRDVFLQALQSLETQKASDQETEESILQRRDEDLKRQQQEANLRRLENSRIVQDQLNQASEAKAHKRSESEGDYGIEDPVPGKSINRPSAANAAGITTSSLANHRRLSPTSKAPSTSKRAQRNSVYKRGRALLAAFQRLLLNMAHSTSKNPAILLRMVLFVIALLLTFSRRDVRDRVNNVTRFAWSKFRGTVGMGVKVSYI